MVSVCHECRGKTFKHAEVRLIFDDGERIRIVDEVPAMVCVQCGARHFSPEVSKALDRTKKCPPDVLLPVELVHFKTHRPASAVPIP